MSLRLNLRRLASGRRARADATSFAGPSSYAHWADGTIINSLLETHQRNAALLAPLQSPSRLSNSSLFAASPFTPAGGHSYALSVENFTHPGRLHRAPWFKRLQAAVTADPLLQIFVPLFVGTDHWALARFDIANNAWSFADSMPGHSTAYLNKARAACGLISEALGYASSSSDDLLPIGSQSDGASCGFFVMDAFVHAVTGAPLAKQSSVDTLRLRGAALLFEESRCSAARQTLDLDSPSPSSSPLSSPIQPSFANAAASSHPFPSDELAPPLQSSDNPPLDGANPSYFDSFEQPIFERIASSSLAQMEAALAIKSDAPFAGFESSDSDSEDINGYESDTSGSSSDSDGGHPDDPEGRKLLAILADANRAEKAAGTEEDQSSVPLQPNLPLHPPLRLQPPPPLSKTKTAKGSAKGDKTRQAISEDKVVARLAADRKAAKAHPLEYQRWRTKILEKDRKVTFDPRRPRFARCGSCHVEKAAKEMFESQRIIDHVTTCPKKNVSAGPMDAFLQRRPAPPLLSKSPATPVLSLVRAGIYPCTGLTKEQHSRIPDYLGTGARGGGGRARQAILVDLFGLEEVAVRKKLKIRKQDRWTSAERRMADTREELEFTWINDHRAQAVRSASCLRTAIVDHPCANCISLLANPRFQRALNRQLTASDTTVKHISKRYSSNGNEELAHRRLGILDLVKDGKSRMLAFVAQLNKGKVGSKVLAGLLEFECEKARREGEGKTLAGIQMPEAAGLLLHSLSLLSSKAYNQLRKYLPAPTIRHFQYVASRRAIAELLVRRAKLTLLSRLGKSGRSASTSSSGSTPTTSLELPRATSTATPPPPSPSPSMTPCCRPTFRSFGIQLPGVGCLLDRWEILGPMRRSRRWRKFFRSASCSVAKRFGFPMARPRSLEHLANLCLV